MSVSRLCKAVLDLLPCLPPDSSRVAGARKYQEIAVPPAAHSALSSLVLNYSPRGGYVDAKLAEAEFSFHKSALLKYLRQLPT